MKRRTGVAVLIAAAVIGCGGGTYVAASMPGWHFGPAVSVSAGSGVDDGSDVGDGSAGAAKDQDSGDSGSDVSGSGGSGSSEPGASRRTPGNPAQGPGAGTESAPLFYLADDRIHDGDRTVAVDLAESWPVSSLQRVGDDWLVTQLHSEGGEQQDYVGTVVSADGGTWDLGAVGTGWDITPDGKVLFSPEPGRWARADPATHDITDLGLDSETGNEAGEQLPGTTDADPEQWIQWTKSGVLTGWNSPDGTRLVQSDPAGDTGTEIGEPGVQRPNTSPDGTLAVGDTTTSRNENTGRDDGSCLTGGALPDQAGPTAGADSRPDTSSAADKTSTAGWWRNCDFRRLSSVSPYSPNGRRLLAMDAGGQPDDPNEFDVLDARTGEQYYQIDAPDWTYDAAWADDETLTVLARPNGHTKKRTVIYQVDLGGNAVPADTVKGKVTLGSS